MAVTTSAASEAAVGWKKSEGLHLVFESLLGGGTLSRCFAADCTVVYFLSAYHTPLWCGGWRLFLLGLAALEFIASMLGKGRIPGCSLDPGKGEPVLVLWQACFQCFPYSYWGGHGTQSIESKHSLHIQNMDGLF